MHYQPSRFQKDSRICAFWEWVGTCSRTCSHRAPQICTSRAWTGSPPGSHGGSPSCSRSASQSGGKLGSDVSLAGRGKSSGSQIYWAQTLGWWDLGVHGHIKLEGRLWIVQAFCRRLWAGPRLLSSGSQWFWVGTWGESLLQRAVFAHFVIFVPILQSNIVCFWRQLENQLKAVSHLC